jgi:stage II sporulation protein P
MNRRALYNFCTILLLFAMAVRVLCASGFAARAEKAVREAAGSPEFLSWMLYLETGRIADTQGAEEKPETRLWLLRILPAQPSAAQKTDEPAAEAAAEPAAAQAQTPAPQTQTPAQKAAPLTFSAAEADKIAIGGACTYKPDKRALLCRASKLDFSQAGPKVLIVHTHSSEAYTQEAGWTYQASDPLRTEDPERSVIRVGTEIAGVLESHGIETLHDTKLNDYPSYNGAYARMETTIDAYLAKYPSIQMVVDVHRDATEDAQGNPTGFTAAVNGEPCAQVMLVMGTNEGGLAHPDWQENLANALKLQALLNRSYPGLCRDIDLRTERFNEHETKGSMLAEFGSTGNTLQEAVRAGHDFAEGLSELILGLQAAK